MWLTTHWRLIFFVLHRRNQKHGWVGYHRVCYWTTLLITRQLKELCSKSYMGMSHQYCWHWKEIYTIIHGGTTTNREGLGFGGIKSSIVTDSKQNVKNIRYMQKRCPVLGGNLVYLELRPNHRKTLAAWLSESWLQDIMDPLQLIRGLTPITYKLTLPASSNIHPVSTFLSSTRPKEMPNSWHLFQANEWRLGNVGGTLRNLGREMRYSKDYLRCWGAHTVEGTIFVGSYLGTLQSSVTSVSKISSRG